MSIKLDILEVLREKSKDKRYPFLDEKVLQNRLYFLTKGYVTPQKFSEVFYYMKRDHEVRLIKSPTGATLVQL